MIPVDYFKLNCLHIFFNLIFKFENFLEIMSFFKSSISWTSISASCQNNKWKLTEMPDAGSATGSFHLSLSLSLLYGIIKRISKTCSRKVSGAQTDWESFKLNCGCHSDRAGISISVINYVSFCYLYREMNRQKHHSPILMRCCWLLLQYFRDDFLWEIHPILMIDNFELKH